MAHDFEMGLLGQVFFETVEGAAVDVHYFVAAQADQVMGMAEGVEQESVFPALRKQDFFRQFLFREIFQDPVDRGKIQAGSGLEQFFIDFIGREHFAVPGAFPAPGAGSGCISGRFAGSDVPH